MLGDDAMKKLSKANVFISGMGGLGIEIGKMRCRELIYQDVLLSNKKVMLILFAAGAMQYHFQRYRKNYIYKIHNNRKGS